MVKLMVKMVELMVQMVKLMVKYDFKYVKSG